MTIPTLRLGPLLGFLGLLSGVPQVGAAQPPQDEPAVLGKPADWVVDRSADERRHIELEAGTELHEEPWLSSPVVGTAPGGVLELWESRPGWARVLVGDTIGWALIDADATPTIESRTIDVVSDDPADRRTFVVLQAAPDESPRLLDRVDEILGEAAKEGSLGPLRLITDLDAPRLFGALDAVARQMPSVYSAAFGLRLPDDLDATVVVFDREEDYAELRSTVIEGPTTDVAGFAFGSVAALYAEGRDRPGLSETLIHEICHLLNGMALRPRVTTDAPPEYQNIAPWLEEGMAESLALSWVDRKGTIHPDRLAKTALRSGQRIEIWGNSAEFLDLILRIRTDGLVPIGDLVQLSRELFLGSENRSLHYVQSAALVRFLVDQDDLRPLFQAFLGDVAGLRASSHDLLDYLDLPEQELERRYRDWIVETTERQLL